MNRIELLASLTKGGRIICDIGCDHAYALIRAIQKYGIEKGYAVEVAQGPLDNAIRTIQQEHLTQQIIPVLSNGFDEVHFEFDTAIIAGMGGILICDILEKGLTKIQSKKLILEPNSDHYKVRAFLMKHHFRITFEQAIIDQGKYYEVLVAEPGNQALDEYDLQYGPLLRRKPTSIFIAQMNKKRQLIRDILFKIQEASRRDEKSKELQELISLLRYNDMEKHFILNTKNYYRTYFVDDQKRPTIFVSPGGGYAYTSPRESEPVVDAFIQKGYHVVVVNYRETVADAYPKPGTYLAAALQEIQKDVRVGKVIGLGFSAGGHCILEMILHASKYSTQPMLDLLMLGYPVITADPQCAHLSSFKNLLLENVDNNEMRQYLSLETQVTKENAPDLFLWGTYTDESVSVLNSIRLIEAYQKVKANVEYHLFPMGGHGLSVANALSAEGNPEKENTYIAKWVGLALDWLELKLKK